MVSAIVVPTGILSRLTGVDVWAWYVGNGIWFFGEVLLVVMLLFEYWEFGRRDILVA
jgi:hypothetical protein